MTDRSIESELKEVHKKLSDIEPAKVSGYKFEFDNFIKFTSEGEINE